MSDSVSLLINKKKIENFQSYRIESNIFTADDAFSLELSNPEIDISGGQQVELFVNGERELTGIIDRVHPSYDKSGRKLVVEGRDLMGVLVDSYCEEFITIENIELKALAARLLKNVKFIKIKEIQYGSGDKNRAVPLKHKKEEYEFTQIEPGQTIFDVLNQYALSRGMLFFSLPKGTFVFGQPVTKGKAEFTLTNRIGDPGENNIISGDETRDISKQYSKLTVMAQKQGTDATAAVDINAKYTLPNPGYPFYKPFVARAEHDGQSPKKYAKVLLEKQQFDGYQLEYKTHGHSQGTKNWQVNAVCHVIDEVFAVEQDFLIYSRVFEKSKENGVFTTLKLSKLGVLPA